MSSSAVTTSRAPSLASRSTHTSPRGSLSSTPPSSSHENGNSSGTAERRRDGEQRSSMTSSAHSRPVSAASSSLSSSPVISNSGVQPKLPSSSSAFLSTSQQQQQQRGEELKQPAVAGSPVNAVSSPSAASGSSLSSSSFSSARRQLASGSRSFNQSSTTSSPPSATSVSHHHRTASSSSSLSYSSSPTTATTSSSSSSVRRSPLPQPIHTTTSTTTAATTTTTPTATTTTIPINPLDNDSLLALIGLRKFQYMQTFIHSDPTPARILPNLYLGSIGAARNYKFLTDNKISHILTIGNNLPVFYQYQFEYLHLVVQDGEKEDIRRHFERCVRFVERGRGGLGEVARRTSKGRGGGGEEEKREVEVVVETGAGAGGEEQKRERNGSRDGSAVTNGDSAGGGSGSGSGKRVDGEGTTPGTGVLLHCFAGRSRSVTILLAYLLTLVHRNPPTHPDIETILTALDIPQPTTTATTTATTAPAVTSPSSSPPASPTPLTLSRLFDYIKTKRPEIKPNAGFVAQLLLLERQLQSVSQQLNDLHIGGSTAAIEVERAVVGVGAVGTGEVREVEAVRSEVVESMAGKERGQEWRKF